MDPSNKYTGEVHKASMGHLPEMIPMFRHGQIKHFEKFPEIFCAPDNLASIENYLRGFLKARRFRKQKKFGLVWLVDGKVGGYVLYQKYQSSGIFFPQNRWQCFIDDIAVSPDFQSRKGASFLMHELSNELSNLGECMLSAQVWSGNEASEALFQKSGFVAQSQNFYRVIKP